MFGCCYKESGVEKGRGQMLLRPKDILVAPSKYAERENMTGEKYNLNKSPSPGLKPV